MKQAGWAVRFRLDPMIPFDGWQVGYAQAIDQINSIAPEMVTLGTLRATHAQALKTRAEKNGRDGSVIDYLSEKDPSGFKYRLPTDTQIELYRFALSRLAAASVPALCKEDASVWQKLGLPFRGCHCLLDGSDDLVRQRPPALVQLKGRASR
jgi:DNA repair photolyase